MIIEDKVFRPVKVKGQWKWLLMTQEPGSVMVSKQQARQLIEVLQRWLAGEEVE